MSQNTLFRHRITTQGLSSLFLSVKCLSYTFIMTPIDSTNDQNTMRYLRLYLHVKVQNILETFVKFGGQRFEFSREKINSLVNIENY